MDDRQSDSQPYQPVQEQRPLPERVAEQLRTMIISRRLAPQQRLDAEPELAKSLSVSRSTLRAALDRLVHEGHIVRKRGVGTFVVAHPPVTTDLNANIGATALIRATGAEPGTSELSVYRDPRPEERVTRKLELPPSTPVVVVDRVRTMSGRRVISAHEFMPEDILHQNGQPVPLAQLEEFLKRRHSIHAFFEERLRLEVQQGVGWLQPASADDGLAKRLHVKPGSLLMYLQQVDYSSAGRPLLLSDEHWVADAFTFTVRRHK